MKYIQPRKHDVFNTFMGGTHPPERKSSTVNRSFENLSIPLICYIPMLQHSGYPAVPVVNTGEIVDEGQIVGKAQGIPSANVHASVPGRVISITDRQTVSGIQQVVAIEAEGAFTTVRKSLDGDWRNINNDILIDCIREAGIVGLSGTGYPSDLKLKSTHKQKINTLIINGSESEPYLTSDDMLMKTYSDEIIEGILIILKITEAQKAIIGVESDKKAAIELMNKALNSAKIQDKISVRQVPAKYPQGSEKLLISSIMRKILPASGTPADAAILVYNVATVYAIREAVIYKKPLIERFITVSGEMIRRPGNYKVRLGTRISDIVEECGGLKGDPSRIVLGGPMRGIAIHDMEIPVNKTTTGVLFLSEKEIYSGGFEPCVRCGKCVKACPVGLSPCNLVKAIDKNRFDLVKGLYIDSCIMCGTCSFVCPAKRPVTQFIKDYIDKLSQ